MSSKVFVDNETISYPYVLRNSVSSVSTTMQTSTAQANCDTQVTDANDVTNTTVKLFIQYAKKEK